MLKTLSIALISALAAAETITKPALVVAADPRTRIRLAQDVKKAKGSLSNESLGVSHPEGLGDDDGQQARFAMSYKDEFDALRSEVSAYLLRDKQQHLESLIVPATSHYVNRRRGILPCNEMVV